MAPYLQLEAYRKIFNTFIVLELMLEECQRLLWLPALPRKIVVIEAADCSSLETLKNALEKSTVLDIELYFVNCFKLVENVKRENNLAVMLLKHRLRLQVYGWGRGEHGRLGFGDSDKSSKLVSIGWEGHFSGTIKLIL